MSYVFDAESVKIGLAIFDSANWVSFHTHRRCDGAQKMRLTVPNNAVKVRKQIEPETMRYEGLINGKYPNSCKRRSNTSIELYEGDIPVV